MRGIQKLWRSARSGWIIITISRRARRRSRVFRRATGNCARSRLAHHHPYARSLGGYDAAAARALERRPGIMHCFTGGAEQAREAVDLGFHLSFGGVVTFPKADDVREAAQIGAGRPAAGGNGRAVIWRPCPIAANATSRRSWCETVLTSWPRCAGRIAEDASREIDHAQLRTADGLHGSNPAGYTGDSDEHR